MERTKHILNTVMEHRTVHRDGVIFTLEGFDCLFGDEVLLTVRRSEWVSGPGDPMGEYVSRTLEMTATEYLDLIGVEHVVAS